MTNPFFKNNGPFIINEILDILNLNTKIDNVDQSVLDVKDLLTSNVNEITFLHSKKYKDIAKTTKASFCITTKMLKSDLPKNCIPIIVENVLVATSKITEKFYPSAVNDYFDASVNNISEIYRSLLISSFFRFNSFRISLNL